MHSRIGENTSVAGAAFDTGQSFDVGAFARGYGGVTASSFSAGALLYRQGEPADAMYYLQDGQIQISVVSSKGKEAILYVLDPGSFAGEGCFIRNRIRVSTATCITDCRVVRLERASVVRALRENPAIAEFFVVVALTKFVQMRESLISQHFDLSEKRLARALILLAQHGGAGEARIIRNLDQEGLAQMIGTTRSRVNHFMNKFRRLRYIDYDGNVILVYDSLSEAALDEDGSGLSAEGMAAAR